MRLKGRVGERTVHRGGLGCGRIFGGASARDGTLRYNAVLYTLQSERLRLLFSSARSRNAALELHESIFRAKTKSLRTYILC